MLAGLAGALWGAPRHRRAARVSHPPRCSSPPRWPLMQKLFPRVPHVKDPVGDSFQNERMVRAAQELGVWAARPAGGSGAEGGALPGGRGSGRAT